VNKQAIIGIDPGLDGATVKIIIGETGYVYVMHRDIDRMDGFLDASSYSRAIADRLALDDSATEAVVIEYPMVLGEQRGTARVGGNWGIIHAVWQLREQKPIIVHASQWKAAMIPKALRPLKKLASCGACEALGYTIPAHSSISRSGKPHDGVADAILIALYGARQLGVG